MESKEKLLLIWEEIPGEAKLYVFLKDSYMADLARNSNGLYINSDELEGNHGIFELEESLRSQTVLETPIQDVFVTEVVKCGFYL